MGPDVASVGTEDGRVVVVQVDEAAGHVVKVVLATYCTIQAHYISVVTEHAVLHGSL
jgi:hypothetical protein